jgi:raffinose/stachyose/melibiose transport system substrate-binding protein
MRRSIIMLLCLIFITSFIVMGIGCKEAETSEEAAAETEETAEETTSEPINLTAWVNPGYPDAIKTFLNGFNEAQDKYIVDFVVFPEPYYETIMNKWAAGDKPDILNSDSKYLDDWRPAENLVDLSDMDFVARTTIPDLLAQTNMQDGVVYGPVILYPILKAPFMNKQVFADAGADIPTNYEELLIACQKIKDAGYFPIAEAGADWPPHNLPAALHADLFFSEGAYEPGGWVEKLNNNEDDFTNPLILGSLQKEKELLDLGFFNDNVTAANWADIKEMIMNNEAAFMGWGGDTDYAIMESEYGVEETASKIGFMPIGEKEPALYTVPGYSWSSWFVVDNGDSSKIEASKELMNYLSGADPYQDYYQQLCFDYGMRPVFEGFESPEFSEAVLELYEQFDKLPSGRRWYDYMLNSSAFNEWQTGISSILVGESTPEQVAEDMSEVYKATAKDAGVEAFQ